MARSYDECCCCGTSSLTLSFVGGQWWCRRCLFDKTYDFETAIVYCLINQDQFADDYPESFNDFWDMLATGEKRHLEAMENFVSDHLEDYAEWVMTNPEIVPFEIICEKARRL